MIFITSYNFFLQILSTDGWSFLFIHIIFIEIDRIDFETKKKINILF